jgi:hypothetical protein
MEILPSSDAALQEEGMNLIDHSIALLTNRSRMQEFGGMCRGKKYFSVLQSTLAAKKLRKRMASRKGVSPNPQASISEMHRLSGSRPADLGFTPESTNHRRSYRIPGSTHTAKLTQAA